MNDSFFLSRRWANFIASVGCFSLIAVAVFYFERHLYLNPCPLCYVQRAIIIAIGLWFLVATIFPSKGRGAKIHAVGISLLALFGMYEAGKHVYLQSIPKDQLPACGQDVYGLFQTAPIFEAIIKSLSGTGECGEIQWQWLGLSIPGWTFVAMVAIMLWAIWHNWFRRN